MATYRTHHFIDPPAEHGPGVVIEVMAANEDEALVKGQARLKEAYPDSVEDTDSVFAGVYLMGDE